MIKHIEYPTEINADVKADTIANKVNELIDILNKLGQLPEKTPVKVEVKPVNSKLTWIEFYKEKRKEGLDMKEASKLWKELK